MDILRPIFYQNYCYIMSLLLDPAHPAQNPMLYTNSILHNARPEKLSTYMCPKIGHFVLRSKNNKKYCALFQKIWISTLKLGPWSRCNGATFAQIILMLHSSKSTKQQWSWFSIGNSQFWKSQKKITDLENFSKFSKFPTPKV